MKCLHGSKTGDKKAERAHSRFRTALHNQTDWCSPHDALHNFQYSKRNGVAEAAPFPENTGFSLLFTTAHLMAERSGQPSIRMVFFSGSFCASFFGTQMCSTPLS